MALCLLTVRPAFHLIGAQLRPAVFLVSECTAWSNIWESSRLYRYFSYAFDITSLVLQTVQIYRCINRNGVLVHSNHLLLSTASLVNLATLVSFR